MPNVKFSPSPCLKKLEAGNPDDPSVHAIGGDLYFATGKLREAQQQYALAANTGEMNYEIWENLVFIDVQLEQFDAAIQHSEQALEVFPNQKMLAYFNGYAHLKEPLAKILPISARAFFFSFSALRKSSRFVNDIVGPLGASGALASLRISRLTFTFYELPTGVNHLGDPVEECLSSFDILHSDHEQIVLHTQRNGGQRNPDLFGEIGDRFLGAKTPVHLQETSRSWSIVPKGGTTRLKAANRQSRSW